MMVGKQDEPWVETILKLDGGYIGIRVNLLYFCIYWGLKKTDLKEGEGKRER